MDPPDAMKPTCIVRQLVVFGVLPSSEKDTLPKTCHRQLPFERPILTNALVERSICSGSCGKGRSPKNTLPILLAIWGLLTLPHQELRGSRAGGRRLVCPEFDVPTDLGGIWSLTLSALAGVC